MSLCPDPSFDAGVVRSVLGSVDCHVRAYSEAGYLALTGPGSFFPTALTILLTIYVALLGLKLLFGLGGARLLDAPLIALKIGLILTLTLNWTAFQTVVFDLTMKAPLQIAELVARPATHSGSELAASPLDGLQRAYDELELDAKAFAKAAGPNPQVLRGGEAAAAQSLWSAQKALFMGTAGLMAIAIIAVGVLVSVGPIFIALFLFQETRGLFAGWLRALLGAALVPTLCWAATAVLLVVLEPWLVKLAAEREAGTLQIASAQALSSVVFIFAAAEAVLAFGAGVIASGFQIQFGRSAGSAGSRTAHTVVQVDLSRPERLALQLQQSARWRSSNPALSPSYGSPAGGLTAALQGGGRGAAYAPAPGPRSGDGYRREAFLDRLRSSRRRT